MFDIEKSYIEIITDMKSRISDMEEKERGLKAEYEKKIDELKVKHDEELKKIETSKDFWLNITLEKEQNIIKISNIIKEDENDSDEVKKVKSEIREALK